jgi:hypothetical protein
MVTGASLATLGLPPTFTMSRGKGNQIDVAEKLCNVLNDTGVTGPEGLSMDVPNLETQIRGLAVAALKRENTKDLVASMASLIIEDQKKVPVPLTLGPVLMSKTKIFPTSFPSCTVFISHL